MYSTFLAGLPIVALALVASAFIKELPLRDTAYADEDAESELPDEPDGSTTNGASGPDRRDERPRP